VIVASNQIDISYVVKGKGTANPVTGSDKVCGNKLCSKPETKSQKEEIKSEKRLQGSISSRIGKIIMNEYHVRKSTFFF